MSIKVWLVRTSLVVIWLTLLSVTPTVAADSEDASGKHAPGGTHAAAGGKPSGSPGDAAKGENHAGPNASADHSASSHEPDGSQGDPNVHPDKPNVHRANPGNDQFVPDDDYLDPYNYRFDPAHRAVHPHHGHAGPAVPSINHHDGPDYWYWHHDDWYSPNGDWYYPYTHWGWGGLWPWDPEWDWGGFNDYIYNYVYPDEPFDDLEPPISKAPKPHTPPLEPIVLRDGRGMPDAQQYYTQAKAAFLHGDYTKALHLAGSAAKQARENAQVYQLISLALFALGDYRAAATDAHAALAMGRPADWAQLYGYYDNIDTYTNQLRALERVSADNPKSPAEHFLLGYQYLMTGARADAQKEFAKAVALTPDDKLARYYLERLQADVPLVPPQVVQ